MPAACHLPQWIDDVPRFHGADGDRGQERVELEEVFLVDQHGVPVIARNPRPADGAGHVQPAESAAENEESVSCHDPEPTC